MTFGQPIAILEDNRVWSLLRPRWSSINKYQTLADILTEWRWIEGPAIIWAQAANYQCLVQHYSQSNRRENKDAVCSEFVKSAEAEK